MDSVFIVNCQFCNAHISDRGKKTVLRADRLVNIVTTDYKTSKMIELQTWRIFDKCPCKIRDIQCKNCNEYIGYHVVQPCYGCKNNNNGHYFSLHKVVLQKTEFIWKTISPIFQEQKEQKPQAILQECRQEFLCPICMDKMINPTIILCGHTFCGTCIQRHIDLKANCPIDIKQMSREGPFISNRLIQQLIKKEEEGQKQQKKSNK